MTQKELLIWQIWGMGRTKREGRSRGKSGYIGTRDDFI